MRGPHRRERAPCHARGDDRVSSVANDQACSCVRQVDGDETRYNYFSGNPAQNRMATKEATLGKARKKRDDFNQRKHSPALLFFEP